MPHVRSFFVESAPVFSTFVLLYFVFSRSGNLYKGRLIIGIILEKCLNCEPSFSYGTQLSKQ